MVRIIPDRVRVVIQPFINYIIFKIRLIHLLYLYVNMPLCLCIPKLATASSDPTYGDLTTEAAFRI